MLALNIYTVLYSSSHFLKTSTDWCSFCIFIQIPEKIMQSAAHLLLSVATTIRPSFLLALETTQTLFTNVSQGVIQTLPLQVSTAGFTLSAEQM